MNNVFGIDSSVIIGASSIVDPDSKVCGRAIRLLRKESVILPTIVIAEVGLKKIFPKWKVTSFDLRSAEILRTQLASSAIKHRTVLKSVWKYDAFIVATIKAAGATHLVAKDGDFKTIVKLCNIELVHPSELPQMLIGTQGILPGV
jgi:predicted nucleic acid-binding protein